MWHVAILVPWPGIKPAPLQWKHRVSTTGDPGKPLYPQLNNDSSPLLPQPLVPTLFCLCKFSSSRNLISVESSNVCLSVPGFFIWHNVFEVHSCCSICQIFYLFKAEKYSIICIHHILYIRLLSPDPGVVSAFWLWIKMTWWLVYRHVLEALISIPRSGIAESCGNCT